MLPNPGTYRARQNGVVIVRQEESGSLMAYIPYLLLNCQEVANYYSVHGLTLGAKDGTPQSKNISTLKSVFPMWDMDTLEDIPMPEEGAEVPQFDLADCFHDDSYTPEGAEAPLVQFKAKWFNPVGGGRKASMTAEERKAALAKWKAKFKALGATSAKPAAAATTTKAAVAQPAKPAAKAAASGPPGRKSTAAVARTSTQEEVWQALSDQNDASDDKLSEEDLGQKYYDALDAVVPDSSQDPSVLTPTNWGAIANNLGL